MDTQFARTARTGKWNIAFVDAGSEAPTTPIVEKYHRQIGALPLAQPARLDPMLRAAVRA